MLQFSTRGTFEDCYTDTPFLRRGSPPPPPLFCVSPISGSELKKGQVRPCGCDRCRPDPVTGDRDEEGGLV